VQRRPSVAIRRSGIRSLRDEPSQALDVTRIRRIAEFVQLPSRNHIPLEHEPAWRQFLDAFAAFTTP
jgi:hypothetical protein